MLETVSYSILIIIGVLLLSALAVFVVPFVFVIAVSGALFYAAFTCGNIAIGIVLFVLGLLFLSGGLKLAKDVTYGVMSKHKDHLTKKKDFAPQDEVDFPSSTHSPSNPVGH